jgi:cysteinyl-tRNA synthetase
VQSPAASACWTALTLNVSLCSAGHARVYVAFDVLYRLLRQLQYDVQYVRNFTDVDDKIIKRAAESGEEPLALAGRFITEFHEDMAALGCLPPTVSTVAAYFCAGQHTPCNLTGLALVRTRQ